jgi:NCS2 family nucleobase:cation symporter-2
MNAMFTGVLRGVFHPPPQASKGPPRKKPPSLVYAVDDVPPPLVTALNATQHVGVIAINLVYPVLIFRTVDTPVEVLSSLIAMVIWSLAVATFLQVYRIGPVGTGFMCPATPTATYFAPSLLAVRLGGLPLVFGMTVFAGLLETAIAPLLNRLRAIFPPEISGLVILMIGISVGVTGLRSLLGANVAAVDTSEWCVAGITLASMIILNVWGRGILRMVCALAGLAVGYVAAGLTGLLSQLGAVGQEPWIGLPSIGHLSWSFDATLIAPFAIASVAAAMKAAGTIAVCQKTNDANWTRPDMRSATNGVVADGLGTAAAGLMGGIGINTSTPVVGLAQATGVASRRVAIAVGAIFLLLGFFPKLTALLAVMPRSVVAPALLFAVAFIIMNGLQVISSRLMDARRTLVLGLSLMAGLAVEVFPSISAMAPKPLAPLVGSSLVLSTVVALVLNLVFRIGIKKTVRLSIEPGAANAQQIEDFLQSNAAKWGARPDVVRRATFAALQLIESVEENCWRAGPITLEASFDEFNLDIRVLYQGEALEFPDRRPSNEQIRDSDDGVRLLAGFMLRRNADRVRSDAKDGRAVVHFHFDH